MKATEVPAASSRLLTALAVGTGVGALGGLIGLGGAEFRLPLLITIFAFVALGRRQLVLQEKPESSWTRVIF